MVAKMTSITKGRCVVKGPVMFRCTRHSLAKVQAAQTCVFGLGVSFKNRLLLLNTHWLTSDLFPGYQTLPLGNLETPN